MQPPPTTTPAPKPKRSPVFWLGLAAAALVGGVCFIGILAAIAIPAFVGYMRRSKTSEAHANVVAIAVAEEAYCSEHSNYLFPAGPVPATAGPEKQIGNFDADPSFHALGVAFPDPVYYSYSVAPQGVGEIVVTAHGDLDGDGAESTYSVHCLSSCSCEHEVQELDPLE